MHKCLLHQDDQEPTDHDIPLLNESVTMHALVRIGGFWKTTCRQLQYSRLKEFSESV